MIRNIALMFSIAALSGVVMSPVYANSSNSNDNKPSHSIKNQKHGILKSSQLAFLNKKDNHGKGHDKGHGFGYKDKPNRGHGHDCASES